MYDAYNEIHELGVVHRDINRSNILRAPRAIRVNAPQGDGRDDPNVLSKEVGLPCRIVDFELSQRCDFSTAHLNDNGDDFLDRLIENLPDGISLGEHGE